MSVRKRTWKAPERRAEGGVGRRLRRPARRPPPQDLRQEARCRRPSRHRRGRRPRRHPHRRQQERHRRQGRRAMAGKLRGRRAGADDAGAPTGSMPTCTSCPCSGALRLSQLTVPAGARLRGPAAPGRALAGHGAQGPPLARRHPRRRPGARPGGAERGLLAAQEPPRRGAPTATASSRSASTSRRPAEMRAIVGRSTPRAGRWRPLLLTAIFTGLRASELRGLRWGDVDLKRGELHVRQRADRYGKIGRPKSEAGERTVPLPPMVVAALREHRLACPRNERDIVFPNSRGGIEHRNTIVERGFHPAQVAAGVVDQRRRGEIRACTACATSMPRGASTGASMAGSSCRSSWCRRGSVTPRSR